MARLLVACLLAGSLVLQAGATGTKLSMEANPVRKVVSMMQRMQGQVEAEAKEKTEMFEKFVCYCKNGDKALAASIDAAGDKIPQLEANIKGNNGGKAQLEADLKSAKADRAEAKTALGKAQAIRNKEEADFKAEAAETKTNIAALAKAIPAIEKGAGAAFIQANTGVTDKLRQLSVSMDMQPVDRDLLASFLEAGATNRGSGEILGILKSMHDEMAKDLTDLVGEEKGQVADYESLVAAKGRQEKALSKAIEEKTVRIGELAVKLAQDANDLEDTGEALVEDKKMLGGLDETCKTKAAEFEAFKKVSAEELVALADTIKLLNDDDALDLFKKTLPSAASSFMQVQVTSKSMQHKALQMLKAAHKKGVRDHRLDFLEIALHGGQMGFDKIIKMVDDLMAVLKNEQVADDAKKGYCLKETDKAEDTAKELGLDISDLGKAVSDGEETMATSVKDVAALTQGIKDLDASVAEATTTRKKENTDATSTLAGNSAAKQLLDMAKNRLNKFYNPKLHKAAPKRQLSEEDQITVNNGGTLAPTAAPGGIAGTGITAFVQVESHHAKQESGGVIAMIDILIADLDKDNQVAGVEEKNSQAEYERFMGDAKDKRALDAKTITDKEGAAAAAEAAVEGSKQGKKDKETELSETKKLLMGLHQDCDWLLKYYDTRKEARADEIDAMDKAKSVLNGADYSFLQTGSMRLRGSQ